MILVLDTVPKHTSPTTVLSFLLTVIERIRKCLRRVWAYIARRHREIRRRDHVSTHRRAAIVVVVDDDAALGRLMSRSFSQVGFVECRHF